MKFEKVIYIRYLPLTKKIYNDFFFKEVINAGIEVEYWDITDLFFERSKSWEDSAYLCNVKTFTKYEKLEDEMKKVKHENTLFISIMTLNLDQTHLYELFLKYNIRVGIFGAVPFPHIKKNTNLKKISFHKILSLNFLKKLYKKIKFKSIIFGRKNPFKYDVIFSAGELGYLGIGDYPFNRYNETKIISVNYIDYDKAYDVLKTQSDNIEKYILFIDEYLPLHPDIGLIGVDCVNSEKYYHELNRFFNHIESLYKMKVIIAAHPKAIKYKTKDYFQGRNVIFNRTAELVKNSKMIIMHDSTSYMYPIFFKKPILFLTSKDIESKMPNTHNNILAVASSINAAYIYFDQQVSESEYPFTLNEQKYESILAERFMATTYPYKRTSNIFIDYLTK